jgi:hypothetical protein
MNAQKSHVITHASTHSAVSIADAMMDLTWKVTADPVEVMKVWTTGVLHLDGDPIQFSSMSEPYIIKKWYT